jgi:hypothetical protein
VNGFSCQTVEFLLERLNLHPVDKKAAMDKFAAVGILQVRTNLLIYEAASRT